MKRTYKTPKAMLVDFCYDEHVAASSGQQPPIAPQNDPNNTGHCQQALSAFCRAFWTDSRCDAMPVSIPGFPVVM